MERRASHRTQWAAQFAVASELCKRGYQVALTLGNHPETDLMVVSPSKVHFVIDVKGQYKPGYWNVRLRRPERHDLFYVLAYVPDDKPNQFFILSHPAALVTAAEDLARRRQARTATGKSIAKLGIMPGFAWASAAPFKDRWRALPK